MHEQDRRATADTPYRELVVCCSYPLPRHTVELGSKLRLPGSTGTCCPVDDSAHLVGAIPVSPRHIATVPPPSRAEGRILVAGDPDHRLDDDVIGTMVEFVEGTTYSEMARHRARVTRHGGCGLRRPSNRVIECLGWWPALTIAKIGTSVRVLRQPTDLRHRDLTVICREADPLKVVERRSPVLDPVDADRSDDRRLNPTAMADKDRRLSVAYRVSRGLNDAELA
jgi:hypothetical protein